MANRIQLRRDTAANWTRVDPVLEDGEPGLEIDTNRVKYGDGNTTWANLSYSGGGSASFDYSTVQEGSFGPSNLTSITGGDDTGVSLTSENWAQLMWVPNTANVTIEDIGDGPATYTWAFVDDEGFHVAASVDEVNRDWRFTTNGNLELPLGGKIGEVPAPTFVGNAVVITPADGTDDNQQLMIYPTVNEGNHLHMTSGNLAVTDIFLGDDYQYIRTRTDQGMTIGTGGGEMWSGNAWTFGANGILSTPGNVQVGTAGTYGSISFVDTISANNYVYANGVSILDGINANTGSVTFDGIKVIGADVGSGSGDIELVPDNTGTYYDDGQYIRIYPTRAIPDAPHIHLAAGYGGDLILGDDYTGVDINHDSNVYIRTNGTVYNWRFDNDGSTTFPDHQPVTISGNLTVGNLTVTGNSSIINTESYVVADNIIQMANANPADTLDLGFVAHRTVDSTLEHTGLVRDAGAGIWRLFSNVTSQPGATVDFTDANYDVLQVGGLNTVNITSTGPLNFTSSPAPSVSPGIVWPSGFQTDIYGNTQVAAYLVANPQGSTYSNTNVAAYLSSQNVTSANIGGSQTYANTQVQTINANLGAFQTYANATFGTSSYGNTSVAAYLAGNISVGNITVGSAFKINSQDNSFTTTNGSSIQFWQRVNFNSTNGIYSNGNINAQANLVVSGVTTASGNVTAPYFVGVHQGNAVGTSATYSGNITAGNVIATQYGNAIGTTATYSGNVTAANFVGSLVGSVTGSVTGNVTGTLTGNVVGTTPNVEIVAGAYTSTFTNTGTVTVPNVTVAGNVTASGISPFYAPNRPAFRVYGNTSTVYTAATGTITTQAVDYNQGSYYNNSTGIFTAPVPGLYHAYGTIRVANNNSLNQVTIVKNNSTSGANVIAFWETDGNVGTAIHFSLTGYAQLTAGDTLRLKVLSGNVNFDSNDSWGVTYIG